MSRFAPAAAARRRRRSAHTRKIKTPAFVAIAAADTATHHRANRRELLQPSSPKGRKAHAASVARLDEMAVGAGQPDAAGGRRIARVRNNTLTTAEPSQSAGAGALRHEQAGSAKCLCSNVAERTGVFSGCELWSQ